MESTVQSFIRSPLGWIRTVVQQDALIELRFVEKNVSEDIQESNACQLMVQLEEELNAYFNQSLQKFSIPLLLKGTEFQKAVWQQLQQIPYGTTWNYQQLAQALNHPKAVRAVANANAQNPLLVLVPCHRVIGSDRQLTGYAGELWRKEKLIRLENSRTKIISPSKPTKPLLF